MSDVTYPVAYADRPNNYHWDQASITWEALSQMVLGTPAKRKECGNYILASLDVTEKVHAGSPDVCRERHRDNRSVSRRSAILALDIDNPEPGFDVSVEMLLAGHAYLLHTTFSSTPAEPRYRLLVQADRDMSPDEYVAATTAMAERLGADQFDSGSFQAARYMFKPGARKREWYEAYEGVGDPVAVDDLLSEWNLDLSEEPAPLPSRNKRDPYSIEGPVGAFNRVYDDLDELIAAFSLPYECVTEDRYTLQGSAAEAGMGPISGAPGLFYSHHANDPAYGVTCSAFDLVRMHLFGDLDEGVKSGTPVNRLPSNEAMMAVATKDPKVVQEIFAGQTAEIEEDFAGSFDDDDEDPDATWRSRLMLDRRGKFIDNVHNWDLIRAYDPVFQAIGYNKMGDAITVLHGHTLPWERPQGTETFVETDHVEIRSYLERTYGFEPKVDKTRNQVEAQAAQAAFVPVIDYLESLEWDGRERVATCLPGADHSDYNAWVARKVLVAAVARMYEPGMKWDHTLVLHGGEGLGKSLWIERMANVGPLGNRKFYSYSLGHINSKDTLLSAHRSWIVTSDEGHSLRKADNDALKEFLTRTQDVFRAPYSRDTLNYPRRFVIWSTTNDDTFLQRQEGNRRFLVVRCLTKFDIDAMTPEYVDQVWAEALTYYRAGERLYLEDDEASVARDERESFLEEDANAGIISEFLHTLVPEDWYDRSTEQRAQWLEDRASGFEPAGTVPVDRTCTQQIWGEVLRRGKYQPKAPRVDLLEIGKSLKALGWVPVGTQRFPGLGPQVIYVDGEGLL